MVPTCVRAQARGVQPAEKRARRCRLARGASEACSPSVRRSARTAAARGTRRRVHPLGRCAARTAAVCGDGTASFWCARALCPCARALCRCARALCRKKAHGPGADARKEPAQAAQRRACAPGMSGVFHLAAVSRARTALSSNPMSTSRAQPLNELFEQLTESYV